MCGCGCKKKVTCCKKDACCELEAMQRVFFDPNNKKYNPYDAEDKFSNKKYHYKKKIIEKDYKIHKKDFNKKDFELNPESSFEEFEKWEYDKCECKDPEANLPSPYRYLNVPGYVGSSYTRANVWY